VHQLSVLFCCSSSGHGTTLPCENYNSKQSATWVETSFKAWRRQIQSQFVNHRRFWCANN